MSEEPSAPVIEEISRCPNCAGEITFGFGLASGGDAEGNPAGYWICLECDWMGPPREKQVCLHGPVDDRAPRA